MCLGRLPPLEYQLLGKLKRHFRDSTHVLGVKQFNGTKMNDVRPNRKWESNMAAAKLEVPISRHVDKLVTKSQRLYQSFRGP